MITQFKIIIPAWIAGQIRRKRICIDPIGVQGRKPCMNPGSMDGFELAIHGTGYPLPGGYDGLTYNLAKQN
jgi:hypothetical protein